MSFRIAARVTRASAQKGLNCSFKPKQSLRFLSSTKWASEQPRPARSEEHKQQSESKNSSPPPKSGNLNIGLFAAALAAVGGAYLYFSSDAKTKTLSQKKAGFEDYQNVYNAIAKKLQDETDWDDGSYGPVLVRLAWHASGTYDKKDGSGGSKGGTMRFKEEYTTAANTGLSAGKDFLQSIHDSFPWISYGDLYSLGGVCAVQELGGPSVGFKAGRVDQPLTTMAPDGRLPDGSKGQQHIRDVFYRMGFNDEEIVALIGAHCLGRCHTQNSGYDGPWTFSPTYFTNDFFKLLVDEKWHVRKWDGPKQYQDDSSNSLMMLPADYALIQDKSFKNWVEAYAKDSDLFFKNFASAFEKLLENGVKFPEGTPVWHFKTLDEQ